MRISDWSSDVCSSDLRLVLFQRGVIGGDQFGIAMGAEHPHADGFLVGAQVQDQVVEFARQRQRPELVALRLDGFGGSRWGLLRAGDGDRKSTRLNSSH